MQLNGTAQEPEKAPTQLEQLHVTNELKHVLTLIEMQARKAREGMCSAEHLARLAQSKGPGLVIAGAGAMDAIAAGAEPAMKQGSPDYAKMAEKTAGLAHRSMLETAKLGMALAKLLEG